MAEIAPRVNSARLGQYVSRTVRLTCKTLKALLLFVQASDGGEVQVRLLREANMTTAYIEVIGSVIDASTIRMMACIDLGNELDMKLVNDVVELWHDPRFAKMVGLEA
ncbi:hypothetical protein IEO21_05292 [Rhodonia placenta]|uniref:Replication factor A protein 3 n=2 Tax=Rhodonia placenta TaxID=104341 RepID=A0A1X6MXL1_9APHY|nr:hypothetical protein POSPLADRAFT_1147083 [Postia placenta MAD-698-R-SB12]KAF9814154.1 hypothetical protein IEO21_05292 [Postia placenta]OSX61098.1 hypothetical protein POSPLADRAFT_1147083 [Postia placenta MAD-698-R-SB12]